MKHKPENRLRAKEWEVVSLPAHSDAVRLVKAWHYSKGASNTSTYRHGLYPVGVAWGEPVGVTLWIPPTRTAAESVAGEDWKGVLVLSRLVVAPDMPTNAASFLLGASMRLIDRERWPTLLTYADTRLGHTGAIYKATNWECLGVTVGADNWVDGEGRLVARKRGPTTFNKQQMLDKGYEQLVSMPKIKYIHRTGGK